MRIAVGLLVLLSILVGGSLGVSAGEDSVLNFADVAARHFHALRVDREIGLPSSEILILYVDRTGDDRHAPTEDAERWLEENLGIRLVDRPGGLPIYFTARDLVGSQGNDALGATIPTGVVVETRSPTLLGCALAHEIGHVVGLKHAQARADIMATRCDHGKLEWATASEDAQLQTASIVSIEAVTLSGNVLWAHRA